MEIDYLDMTIGVVGGLAVFLFGMKIMSEGLQKSAGDRMRSILAAMTNNKLAGVGTGLAVTAVIQSSSATTVMLVGFVNAGLMTLEQSIGVIMGANIGTTATAWLVSLFGFKVKISAMALPAVAIGFIPRFIGNKKLEDWGEVLIGFGVLFIGLGFMKDAVGVLKSAPEIRDWITRYCGAETLLLRMVPVMIGMAFTFIVQSSSAAMAVTMTMAAQGLISLETACALALGQNIGTTITANLASIGTSVAAKQAARAHFLFNLLGSVWPILLFYPFLSLIGLMVPIDLAAHSTPLTKEASFQLTMFLAAFHSVFNIVNTALFLPFASQLAWLSTKLVFGKQSTGGPHLKFLDPKVMNSPPMALHAARREMLRMLEEVQQMFDEVVDLISHPREKMGKVADRILAGEETVDMLEHEISEYLVPVARLELSTKQSHEVAGILSSVSDLERIGDHCESLLKLARRRYEKDLPVGEDAMAEILELAATVKQFLGLLHGNIVGARPELMAQAKELEDSIDAGRKKIRRSHIARIKHQEYGVQQGIIYIDMLTSLEKIGDHAFNVAQTCAGVR